jgi:hypothetical protein
MARYNAAKCWLGYAKTFDGEDRKKNLAKAIRTIDSTRSHDPEMGGETWQGKYKRLREEIDAAQ